MTSASLAHCRPTLQVQLHSRDLPLLRSLAEEHITHLLDSGCSQWRLGMQSMATQLRNPLSPQQSPWVINKVQSLVCFY